MNEVATLSRPWDLMDVFPTIFNFGIDRPQLRVEEFREGNTLTIRADMPGLDPDKDVEITLENGRLHIQAERREQLENRTREGFRSAIKYGMFARELMVPEGTKQKDVRASYVDGVLQVDVTLPQSNEKPAHIPVARKAATK